MDLRVLLSTLFLLGVVCLPALKAEDLSEIDSPMMDWIDEDGLTRMVKIDQEMESDDYNRIDDEPRDSEDDTDDDYSDDYGDEDEDDDDVHWKTLCTLEGLCKAEDIERPGTLYIENINAEDCNLRATHRFKKCSNTDDMPITATYTDKNGKSSISKIPNVANVPKVPNVPNNAGSTCTLEGNCKADPDQRSMISTSGVVSEYKNLSAEECNSKATHLFEKCSNTEDMPITATYTDKNGKTSISKINKYFKTRQEFEDFVSKIN